MSPRPADQDQELMLRYQSGDASAFESIYSRHAGRVYGYLLKKTNGDREQASELHQAVFLKFHQSRASYRSEYPVLQWLFVIARSVFLDQIRKNSREVDSVGDEGIENFATPEEDPSQDSEPPSLEGLTNDQREAVEARYLRDESFSEIARRLGKTEVSVRKMISRAIQKLRSKKGVADENA